MASQQWQQVMTDTMRSFAKSQLEHEQQKQKAYQEGNAFVFDPQTYTWKDINGRTVIQVGWFPEKYQLVDSP